jgi:hypothetical protein
MRQIVIIFKQGNRELGACTADFVNRDEATELENKLADASKASITTALGRLPGDLVGEEYGTRNTCGPVSKAGRTTRLSRGGDDPKKSMRELQIPASSVSWLLGFYLITQSSSVPIVCSDAMRKVLFTI